MLVSGVELCPLEEHQLLLTIETPLQRKEITLKSVHKKQCLIFKVICYHDSSFTFPVLLLILLQFPAQSKSWTFQVESLLHDLPISFYNVDNLTSSHDSLMLLKAFRRKNPFQKVFSLLCWGLSKELCSKTIWQFFFSETKLDCGNDSLSHGLKDGWCLVRYRSKMVVNNSIT